MHQLGMKLAIVMSTLICHPGTGRHCQTGQPHHAKHFNHRIQHNVLQISPIIVLYFVNSKVLLKSADKKVNGLEVTSRLGLVAAARYAPPFHLAPG
jgi:hypothetical protein